MRYLQWLVLSFALVLASCTSSAPAGSHDTGAYSQDAPTIFIIRHLQKAKGEDPVLTSEGAAAAEQLANILEDKKLVAIYATATRRAMQTGEPLARKTGLSITQYDPRDPDALVEMVGRAGGAVLVVGHSNTVGDLVTRFGGAPAPQLTERDYGTLFAVSPDGAVREISID